MYFGIYGIGWIKERKEIIQLYLNKYWSRPSELEKPKYFEKIKEGKYW